MSEYYGVVSAGYLKVASPLENGYCRVRIPNRKPEKYRVFVIGLKLFCIPKPVAVMLDYGCCMMARETV